jgi:chitinase
MLAVATPLASAGPSTNAAPRGNQVVRYFIEWGIYGRNFKVKDVKTSGSADKLTVLNYAFGNVAPDASGNVVCKLGDERADYQRPWTAEESVTGEKVTWPRPILGNFQQLQALEEQYPNLKVLISLGGWKWSEYFSDAALTKQSRERFVSSCIDLFIKGNSPIRAGAGWAAPEPPPASSTGSTSTGSGPAPKETPATSSARRTSRTTPCCSASSRSSSTPTGRRRTRTTC